MKFFMGSGEPIEPGWTCPMIDEAIAEMEKARTNAEELREWGGWYKDKYEEQKSELEEKDKEISELNYKISSLDDEIRSLRKALENIS